MNKNLCLISNEKDGFYHSPENTFGVGKIAYEISLEKYNRGMKT